MADEIEVFNPAKELTKGEEKFFSPDGLKPAWQPLKTELFDSLMEERPDCDTITRLTLERISHIYAKMRQIEASGTTVNDQKEFMKMYNELIAALNKIDEKQQSVENMRAEVVQMITDTVIKATAELPEAQRTSVLSRIMGEDA